jgi:cephalosporin-C deacetylase
MPSMDMPLDALHRYKPSLYREEDFSTFWTSTVSEAMSQPLNAELVPYDVHAKGVTCYAVRFDGFGGGRIAGWYLRPDAAGKVPGLMCYHGYGGRGQRPLDLLAIASQGIAVLSMDCRGQNGESQDTSIVPEGQVGGWMTKGIRDRKTYYYRYVYADALRALELLARRHEVDPDRLALTGGSQGGGITLAAAALTERPLALAMPDIPFLCDFRRAIEITGAGPYPEIITLLKAFPEWRDRAMRTLSYFDCMNLAPDIRCRTIVSNGLWDDVCPPSTIFGMYHHLQCEKQMAVYPYHKHEVPYEHNELRFRTLIEVLRP